MNAPRLRRGVIGKSTARLHKAERKRQILQHAKELFVSLGYQHTTTDKIAKAAGVTEPVLYRHFRSKKALFLEVLTEIREATVLRWQQETNSITDPLARLHAIVGLYLGSTRDRPIELRVMYRTLLDADDREIAACLLSFYLDTEKLLCQIIVDGQQSGVFRPDLDPRVAAWEFIRNALGYTLTAPLGVPLYGEEDYLPKAAACMLSCMMR